MIQRLDFIFNEQTKEVVKTKLSCGIKFTKLQLCTEKLTLVEGNS